MQRWSKIRSRRWLRMSMQPSRHWRSRMARHVLVGHSWGGVVITQAGDDPKVSALVYVSAFAPGVGESLADLAKGGPATEGTKAIHPDEKGNLYIDPKVFPRRVAADLPPTKVAESLGKLRGFR